MNTPMLNRRRFSVLLALLALVCLTGCGSSTVANDTPQRQLVREATDANLIAKAVYGGLVAAHQAGLLSDAKLVSLEPAVDAAEAGRKQLTADAASGNVTKADATKNALLATLGTLSQALLEAQAPKPKPVTPVAPPADSEPTAPPLPR